MATNPAPTMETTRAVSEVDLSDCFGGDGSKINAELSAFFYDSDGKLKGQAQEELDELCDFSPEDAGIEVEDVEETLRILAALLEA